ncbi:MAG: EAL domain-containing protein [Candidatus Dormibacteria bacterium]
MGRGPALLFGTEIFPLTRAATMVGRADEASGHMPDINLLPFDGDRVVSRRHAEVQVASSGVALRDLGSTNGTFVQGERLVPNVDRALRDGEEVRFGHVAMRYAADVEWSDEAGAEWSGATFLASGTMMRALGGIADHRSVVTDAPSHRDQIERIQRVRRENMVTMNFQPIVDLARDVVVGVESLARIPGPPPRGPDKWFDEAFEVGLGIELELIAIENALLQLGALDPGVYMSVNTSPSTVISEDFHAILDRVDCSRLVVEVTEHAAVTDYEQLLGALGPYRARGLRLAVDDMGSGHANMKHILELAPDLIKLDTSLVSGIDTDSARQALASSLVSFARAINAKIVAEGLETQAEFDTLRRLEVPLGQGYYLARPGPLPYAPRAG